MLNRTVKKFGDTNESEPQKQPVTVPEAEGRSILPGEADDNPFRRINPRHLRKMYDKETDSHKKSLMWHALKQWARQFEDSQIQQFPYKKYFDGIAEDKVAQRIAQRFAEVKYPSRNLFYYQDAETNSAADIGRNDGLGWNDPPVGGSEGNKDPMKWEKTVYPEQGKYEQNRPEEHRSWGGGSFSAPYEGTIKKNLMENDGSAGRVAMNFFKDFVWSTNSDLEDFFKTKKASRKKTSKIMKMADFDNFIKVGNDLLIHKSDKDLWAMDTDDDGNIVVSRLFDSDRL